MGATVTEPFYTDDSVRLFHGDCLDVLRELPDNSVDSVVTDPPYGLEFMGREWDAPWKSADASVHAEARNLRADEMGEENKRRYIAAGVNKFQAGKPFQDWCEQWATECLRVLKPGGHMLAFGGSRTWHRLTCAIEDAGFEIRDSIAWLYGSGFPKSLDVSKAIDKAAGAEREVVGHRVRLGDARPYGNDGTKTYSGYADVPDGDPLTAPATPDAQRWQGWGTALKPAFEPIVVARKPLAGTVAANVLAHGTGALNIEACRVGTSGGRTVHTRSAGTDRDRWEGNEPTGDVTVNGGRWPSNVVLDDSQAAELDKQSGPVGSWSGNPNRSDGTKSDAGIYSPGSTGGETVWETRGGGASRFFPTFKYEPKAPTTERPRDGVTAHPTVKPLDLMRWLVRLVTPPGGTVLEPFAGSGTTAEACVVEGFKCVAIEREADYLPLIVQRLSKPIQVALDFDSL